MSVAKVSTPTSIAVLSRLVAGTGINSSKLLARICVNAQSLSCLKFLAYVSRGNCSFCWYSDMVEILYPFILLLFPFVG